MIESSSCTVTMQMVADAAHVSIGSVSKYINNGSCSLQLSRRIEKAISSLGYKMNQSARAMRSQRTRCLGILVNHQSCLNSLWLHDLLIDLTVSAGLTHYHTHLRFTTSNLNDNELFLDFSQRIDGLILLGTFSDSFLNKCLHEFSMPIISNCVSIPGFNILTIPRDMTAAYTQMFAHLTGLGHKDITVISTNNLSSREKINIIRKSHEDFSDFCNLNILSSDNWEDDSQTGYALTALALQKHPETTVFLYLADIMALGGISQLSQHRLRIPQDISVVSTDNTTWACQHHPALSSIGYAPRQLSAAMINLLTDTIEKIPRNPSSPLHFSFFPRESTAQVSSPAIFSHHIDYSDIQSQGKRKQ